MPAGAPGASAGRPSNSVRMLAAYFDAAAGYATGAAGTQGHAALQGLRLESHIILNSDEVEKRLATITQVRPHKSLLMCPRAMQGDVVIAVWLVGHWSTHVHVGC